MKITLIKFIKSSAFLLLLFCLVHCCKAQPHDLSIIKQRVISELLKNKPDDPQVESILSKMTDDGSFKDINYSDLSRTASFPQGRHTNDLAVLGRAYKTKSSVYYQSEQVKKAIIKGLEYWISKEYVGDNWHDNQITTPTNLINLMLAMGYDLPKELTARAQPIIVRANMDASGARPSGDRIVIAGLVAKNLLFLGKDRRFDEIINIIAEEI